MSNSLLRAFRNRRPATPDELWAWVAAFTGVRVARAKVCRDHAPPLEWLSKQVLDVPDQILVLGSRGSGKSFLEAIATHVESRHHPKLGTVVLGGSKAQAAQIYQGIDQAVLGGRGVGGSDADSIAELLKESARYRNGSHVRIVAASRTSVRGPHVPRLRLDEVDEIDPDIRESAMGMNMAMHGASASVSMTSTWHRVGGPMGELVERGRAGEFPTYTTCTFDVLERCPESRSGPAVGGAAAYARCPECAIVRWCHSERDRNGGHPLAKLSDGHYSIAALAQKARTVSSRTFDADYLCKGPRTDGLWFKDFDQTKNVTAAAAYDAALPVHLAIDSGVFTGAVAFQVRPGTDGRPHVSVFMDYLSEGSSAEANAKAILRKLGDRNGTRRKVTTDPAGGSRNAIGPTVLAEYDRAGLKRVEPWPLGSVADGLALVESLLCSADGGVSLVVHPSCKDLVTALSNYRRKKRAGQWMDEPEDPQHPFEDLVDALRGGLRAEFPDGLKAPSTLKRAPLGKVMY